MREPGIHKDKPVKPLGFKAYGSTPHLVGSRVGPADHTLPEQQSRLFTHGPARRGDRWIVTEKVDGSCAAAARIGDEIVALSRSGYLAKDSPWPLHHAFARWVEGRKDRIREMLLDGERLCGEWMYTAMGTLYRIEDPDRLFVPFSVIKAQVRIPYDEFVQRCDAGGMGRAHVISDGPPLSIEAALSALGENGFHGALDGIEGAVWVHETKGRFNSIAKFVRHEKVDGKHMSSITGKGDVCNYFGPEF